MRLSGSVLQSRDSAGKHRRYRHFCCLLDQIVLGHTFSCALSLRGTSLAVFLWFLLTGTLPKPCSSAASVLNNFFKICQNFVDHGMTLHYSPGFWLVVPDKHCRTSSRNRVLPMLCIPVETRTNPCQTAVVGIAPSGILWNTTSKLRNFTKILWRF